MDGVTVQTGLVPKPNPPMRVPSAEDLLAKRVKYERLRRNWSADELAKRMTDAGVPINQSAVWRIENATPRRRITVDEAIGFARVFGLELGELVGTDPRHQMVGELQAAIRNLSRARDELRDRYRDLVLLASALLQTVENVGNDETVKLARELTAELIAEYPWLVEPGSGEH